MKNTKTFAEWIGLSEQVETEVKIFYNNKFHNAKSGKTFTKPMPHNLSRKITVAQGDKADIDLAVQAAEDSYRKGVWRNLGATERKKSMLRWVELMKKNYETIALLESMDMGKPISFSIEEDMSSGVNHFEWMAEAIDKVYDEITPPHESYFALLRREPLGVVGCIVPWNYPFMMTSWKVAPALAAGNSVVLKPSEKSPLSAQYIAKLWVEAGLPPGVFNVVPGLGGGAGNALAYHSKVRCLAFTGSTGTAKKLMQASGESNLKRIWIEAGGKSPFLVFEDADLKRAANTAAEAIFYNQGEVCIAGSRLILTAELKKSFLPLLIEEAKNWIPGHPLDPKTSSGAIVDQIQFERIQGYIKKGREEAQEISLGSLEQVNQANFIGSDAYKQGLYVLPTIFDDVDNRMAIGCEEIFGPVLSIITAKDEANMIELANDTPYGLAASVWTKDIIKADRVARDIEAGSVWVNCWGSGDAALPFGGLKESGFGRDKSLHALEKYSDIKSTIISKKN